MPAELCLRARAAGTATFAELSHDWRRRNHPCRLSNLILKLQLSLAANATHGKQRTVGDFKRGYAIALRNALVEPDNSVGLMELLRCSIRTAEDLTETARKAVVAAQKKARDANIIEALDRGEAVRDTAERLGLSAGLVSEVQRAALLAREADAVAASQAVHAAQTAEREQEPESQQEATEPTGPGAGTDGTAEGVPPILAYLAETVAEADDGPEQDEAHEPVSVAAAELPDEAARIRAGMAEIESPEVRMWHDALDALRASLRANAEHGKRREDADYRRGYQLAIKHQLVPPTDSEAVADLLRCSVRWAETLTRSARERERILEQQRIERLKAEGKTNRQVAAEVGLDRRTVDRRLGGANAKPSLLPHPIEADPDDPRQTDIEEVLQEPTPASPVRAALVEHQDPRFIAWHKVLEALRVVNALAPVDRLFADRQRNFDHAIGPEMERAPIR